MKQDKGTWKNRMRLKLRPGESVTQQIKRYKTMKILLEKVDERSKKTKEQ